MRKPVVRVFLVAATAAVFFAALLGTAPSTTDADVHRYFAYSNAMLGRPYDTFYVRSPEAWQRDFISGSNSNRAPHTVVVPSSRLTPYRDFLVEYPPGFFLAVVPPALVTTSETDYKLLFEAWMGAWIAVSISLCARIGNHLGMNVRRSELAFWTVLAGLALGRVTIQRYDAMVAALVCFMCWATLARRPMALGLSAGTAIAAKIVPVFVAIVCGLYLFRERRIRELAVAAIVTMAAIAAICAPVVVRDGTSGLIRIVQYHRDRPLELESTPASILALWHAWDASSSTVTYGYGLYNLIGRFATLGQAASLLACLLTLGLIYGVAWRLFAPQDPESNRGQGLLAVTIATLTLFIACWKVASLQYLWWVVPLGVLNCLAEKDWGSLLLIVGALILAQIVFPLAWGSAQSLQVWPSAAILGRNLIMAVWAAQILSHVWFRRLTTFPE